MFTINVGSRRRIERSFLDNGKKYVTNLYTDDETVQTRTNVRVTRVIVDSHTDLSFHLKASGGCAIHLTLANKDDLRKHKAYKKIHVL